MPTYKELNEVWETQYDLFGGDAIPQESFDDDFYQGGGLSVLRYTDKLTHSNSSRGFSGPVVGKLVKENAKIFLISSE